MRAGCRSSTLRPCEGWCRPPRGEAVATLHIEPGGKTFLVNPAQSILNTLLAGGYPIDTVCGGRAQCGRCIIRVRSGNKFLSPRTPAEMMRLAALGADHTEPDSRLACQCHTRGEAEIEVVNLRNRNA